MSSIADLRPYLRPGDRIALGDGVGTPHAVLPTLSATALEIGDLFLLLGWAPVPLEGLAFDAFTSVRTLMGGYGLRRPVDAGEVRYVAARLGAAPALLNGPLRVDVLLASVSASPDGHRLATESAWQRAAVDAGARVLAVERPDLPCLEIGPPLPADRVVVIGSSPSPATGVEWGEPNDVHRRIGERVAALIPAGARVQYGPGPVGTAVLDSLTQPVHVDTGMLTDAVVDLDRRGLLSGTPLAPYSGATARLYDWAPGRAIVARLEHTHDPVRLAASPPLIAVNTALEIDRDGQVNVEHVNGSTVAGIGGHPDYAFAATRSFGGLSVVAVPTHRGTHRTLVERLSGPASTAAHDIDMIVTEHGASDLRGLDRAERRRALDALWS